MNFYGGLGVPFGKNLEPPKGLGYVALQAPELVNPRMANPGSTEARAAREGASLARHLQGRSLHFVGYSFGGHFAVATRCALVLPRRYYFGDSHAPTDDPRRGRGVDAPTDDPRRSRGVNAETQPPKKIDFHTGRRLGSVTE